MKKIIYMILLLLFVISLFSVSELIAQNQMTTTNQNMQQQIDHLKQQLDFLKQIIKQFPSAKLMKIVQDIETNLQSAMKKHQAGRNRLAAQDLLRARAYMEQAFQIVLNGPIKRFKEQVDEKIRIAEEAIHRSFNSEAQKLLQQAKESRKKAIAAFQNNQTEKAFEWLRVALFQANKAMELVAPTSNVSLADAVHEEKSNYEDLLRRAQNMVRGYQKGMAHELFGQAMMQGKKAENALVSGNYKQAIELFRWGSRMLLRVMDLTSDTEVNWQRRANEELQMTRELIRSMEQSTDMRQHPQLQKLMQQAMKVYLDGEYSNSTRSYPDAVKKFELARRILNRANQLADQRGGEGGVELNREIEMLQNLLSNLEKEIDTEKNPGAVKMWEIARKHLMLSDQANRMNQPYAARANLFVSTRFAYGLQSMIQQQNVKETVQQNVLSQYDLFKNRFDTVVSKYGNSSDERIRTWLQLADEIRITVEQAKENGQYGLLLANARIGLQILNQIEND